MADMNVTPIVKLQDGLDWAELEHGTNFSLQDDFITEDMFNWDECDRNEVMKQSDKSCGMANNENMWPFQEKAMDMENITTDGGVKKKILVQGTGSHVTETSAIEVHYNMYYEYLDEPFDSTYLRDKPLVINLQGADILQGLRIAVLSMKKDEYSEFLVNPEYAYGSLGVPPRIPPNEQILIKVRILNVSTTDEEASKIFTKVLQKAESFRLSGNNLYKQGRFGDARRDYMSGIELLIKLQQDTTESEAAVDEALVRLYLNVSECFLQRDNPKKACTFIHCAERRRPENYKVHLKYGKAKSVLHNFDEALRHFNKAKQLNDDSKFHSHVDMQISKMNEMKRKENEHERAICRAMFNRQPSEKQNQEIFPSELLEQVTSDLKKFTLDSEVKTMPVLSGVDLNEAQLRCLQDLAISNNVTLSKWKNGGRVVNYFRKSAK